jgi:hypothetical protein
MRQLAAARSLLISSGASGNHDVSGVSLAAVSAMSALIALQSSLFHPRLAGNESNRRS